MAMHEGGREKLLQRCMCEGSMRKQLWMALSMKMFAPKYNWEKENHSN
jgi:hypothetical protein